MKLPLFSAARLSRGRLLRLIIDHNPFYLLSALCMLGGLLTLTNSSSYSPIPQRSLLLLIATLNGYELLLVVLALWLIVSRKLIRDGAILLGIEALFLADTAMLNAELFTIDRRLGAIVNLLLLLLAAAKLAAIFRALRVRSPGAYALILANLLVLFALPGIFKQVSTHDNGRLSAVAIYAAWWAVGLIPLGFAFVFRRPDANLAAVVDRGPKSHWRIVATFVAFAFISILVHLRLSNWVYQVGWEWANLTPLILGLAVCIGLMDSQVHTLALRLRSQLALPVLAILFSLQFSNALICGFGPLALSPMRFALAGAAMVYLHGWWVHRHLYFAIASAVCIASIPLGVSPYAALHHLHMVYRWLDATYRRIVPRTQSDWGVLSVMASFVLLVLGALFSLMRGSNADEEQRAEAVPGKA